MKQDPKLVSLQPHEIKTVASMWGCSAKTVREIQKAVGVSRVKIYSELKKRGYVKRLLTKTKKS